MNKKLFHKVCDEVVAQGQGLMGIGTLGEKNRTLSPKKIL